MLGSMQLIFLKAIHKMMGIFTGKSYPFLMRMSVVSVIPLTGSP